MESRHNYTQQRNQQPLLNDNIHGAENVTDPEDRKIQQVLHHKYKQYESKADTQKKKEIITKIAALVREWIQECGRLDNKDNDTVMNSGGKIFPTGSYRLGVYGPSSDIDILVVVPRHIDRTNHFFKILAPKLRQIPDVTELNEVVDTAVPVIKMKFEGIDVDLLFARIEQKRVGDELENLDDNNIFRNLDDESKLSLKGRRDTDLIDRLVPQKDTFRLTLRCIKLWAKKRGIYSNVLGYLGGVSWALLVARVCIDNPGMPVYKLLTQFFKFYTEYQWGPQNPLAICPILNDSNLVTFDMGSNLFKELSYKDMMPIMTPSFPSVNSSFNISESTKEVFLTEFEKGQKITQAICEGQPVSWSRLFKPFPFFKAYQHFLMVTLASKTIEDHDRWFGFAETKVKKVVKLIETLDIKILQGLLECRPHATTYNIESEQDKNFPVSDTYFIGLRIRRNVQITKNTIDINGTRQRFFDDIFTLLQDKKLTRTIEALIEETKVDIKVEYRARAQLPVEVRPKDIAVDEMPNEI